MSENEEILGLIPDSEFGVRWKNGSIDRRIRGDMAAKPEDYKYQPTYVDDARLFEHISTYLTTHIAVSDLLIEDTMLMDSIRDGDIAYYNRAVKSAMDIDCRDITKDEFNYFAMRIKLNFVRHGKTFLNGLTTADGYSKFTGMNKNTVYKQIERGILETFQIYDVKFIVIQEDQMMDWNRFLMQEVLRRETCTNRAKIAELYEKMYGDIDVSPIDSISEWTAYCMFVPEQGENTTYYARLTTSEAYKSYCDYCASQKIDSLPARTFSLKMTAMGFKRFNGRKRGFIYWKGKEK